MRGCDVVELVIKNVSKSFDGKKVIDNFSLSIFSGNSVSIMGESGSGKTTLLNIIAGLTTPDSGTVILPQNNKVSVCFQEDRLVDSLTVYRNIKVALDYKISKKQIQEELLQVGLDCAIASEKVSTLSGGMKRRVALLRALLADSDIVLLDEPTKGLDDANKKVVLDYIKKQTKNKILIFITHDIDEARYISDKIITIK